MKKYTEAQIKTIENVAAAVLPEIIRNYSSNNVFVTPQDMVAESVGYGVELMRQIDVISNEAEL